MNDEERIAYLAGEPGGETGPDERAELDDLQAFLADPTVWAEPSPALEDRVVAAVTEASEGAATAPRGDQPRRQSRRRAAAVTGGLVRGGGHHYRPCPSGGRGREAASPVQGRFGGHGSKPGCSGRGDAHEDDGGVAGQLARHRAPTARERALLRGVAQEP